MALRKALAWSVSGQFLSFAISFGGSVAVARLLTPHDLGVFAIAMATIAVLNTIAAFSVGTYVVRATDLRQATLESAFTVNALLAVVLAAIIYSASTFERTQLENLPGRPSPSAARAGAGDRDL